MPKKKRSAKGEWFTMRNGGKWPDSLPEATKHTVTIPSYTKKVPKGGLLSKKLRKS